MRRTDSNAKEGTMKNRTFRRTTLVLAAAAVVAAEALALGAAAPPTGRALASLGESPLLAAAGTVARPLARTIATGVTAVIADASIALMRGGIEIGRAVAALTPDGPVSENTGPSDCAMECVEVEIADYSVAAVDLSEGTNCSITAARIIAGGNAPCASTKSLNCMRSKREPRARSVAVRSSMRRL
jgi:hypothetical protein